jgi:hypothetical protein
MKTGTPSATPQGAGSPPWSPRERSLRASIHAIGWRCYMGMAHLYLWPDGHPEHEIRERIYGVDHGPVTALDRERVLEAGLRRVTYWPGVAP